MKTKLKPLDGKPMRINSMSWLYVEPKSLCVVRQTTHNGARVTLLADVPWRKVRDALAAYNNSTRSHAK